ncbi:MAG: PEP/pyruvate-binding domain-containing protein [Deltaproteobacteria bacterium]
MAYILNFDAVDKESIDVVGGKNASLGEMIKAGIRVPPGFAVTTTSYDQFITDTGIKDRIYQRLGPVNVSEVAELNSASEDIQEMILAASTPHEIQTDIEKGYKDLCEQVGRDMEPVAVRSSATAEDLPTASFAGQQDTYLWIQGPDAVLDHVKRCWASLFTPRAISYRVKNNFDHDKVFISVGVQKMVNSKAAGVMFTLNPTNGDVSKVLIEGSWGLGETVVSGSVNPDKFVVDKVVMEINEKAVAKKHIACVYDPESGGVMEKELATDVQCTCCLEDEEVRELVTIARKIERHYGRAMDIEWAIDQDLDFPENTFIVQARPETVWSQRKAESKLGRKTGRQLLMEQAMKRIKIPH